MKQENLQHRMENRETILVEIVVPEAGKSRNLDELQLRKRGTCPMQ